MKTHVVVYGNTARLLAPSIRERTEEEAMQANMRVSTEHTLPSVAIIGCGGIGWWVAQFIRYATRAIYLYDAKHLTYYHTKRMNIPVGMIGMNKAEALAALLASSNPNPDIEEQYICFSPEHLTSENMDLTSDGTIIIDCTDSAQTHIELYKIAQNYMLSYYRISYDGISHCTIAAKSGSLCNGPLPAGYTVIPTFAPAAILTAAIGVYHILEQNGIQPCFSINCSPSIGPIHRRIKYDEV